MVYIERQLCRQISKWIDNKEILVIRGPRQAGKTTLLKHLQGTLRDKGIESKKIHFITCEDDLEKDKFEKNPKDYIDFYVAGDSARHFFFLDEVQYIKNAGKIFKLLFDSSENVKFIVTGSSSLDLNEMGGSLVGRALFFELYPFSFQEFLAAKGDEKIIKYYEKNKFNIEKPSSPNTLFLDRLSIYLKEYITYGGYPAVVLERDIGKKKFLLRNIFQAYVEKDIVKNYGIQFKDKAINLIKHLASINSSMVNYEEAGKVSSLYFKELKEVLSIFEDTYIIKLIRPFHKNLTTELKKNPKVYFIDSGLRNCIVERFEFNDDEFGKLFENYIFNVFKDNKLNYWRTSAKAEVDFIVPDKNLPIEAKITPKITRSLRSFIESYSPKTALICCMKEYREEKIGKTKIFILPAAFL